MIVQLDDKPMAELDKAAKQDGVSRSELLRAAAVALLEARKIRRLERRLVDAYREMPQDPVLERSRPEAGRGDRSRLVKRGEIYRPDLGPPAGRRPVLLLSRNAAIPVLSAVVVAPISRTVRDIASEVRLGPEHGLPVDCAASCDNLLALAKDRFERSPVGILGPDKIIELDRAIRFALEISY